MLKKRDIERKGKKAVSHVDIILSFVIFTGFLIFLIAIFKPFKISGGEEVYLDMAERKIRDLTSTEVKFLTIRLNANTEIENCFCFDYDFSNVTVKNKNYSFVNALSKEKGKGRKGRKVCIDNKEVFFYIYSCEDFKEERFDSSNCIDLEENNYTLGLFRKYDMASWRKLNELNKSYEENYDEVKNEIGLPGSKDFSFNIRKTEAAGEVILRVKKEPPKGVKVLARDIPIQIVHENGTLNYAILNIRVW